MEISILKPGILSTIQDLGRMDYLDQAIPISGAIDQLSARIANKAVGNSDEDAVIEFTYAAAEFKAETEILIAYAGDGATLSANGEKLPTERPIFVPAETVIKLINNPEGARTYLSIAGGWNVPEILGSRSTYLTADLGGYGGRPLKIGDHLKNFKNLSEASTIIIDKLRGNKIKYLSWNIAKALLLPKNRKTIRVVPAREFNWFNGQSIIGFLSDSFSIGLNSNRMGYHLKGNKINRIKKDELLSTAVVPGTIQVTGSGNLVLLMADCQTTGGYPRIAQVASVDLPLCAQLKPGDSIRFSEISKEEAEFLYIEREKELTKLNFAINSRF